MLTFLNIQTKFIRVGGELKLGKVDWPISNIPNHKSKSVFKSIIALLDSSVS